MVTIAQVHVAEEFATCSRGNLKTRVYSRGMARTIDRPNRGMQGALLHISEFA